MEKFGGAIPYVRKTLASVQLCGNRFAPAFAAGIGLVGRNSFRTWFRLAVRVQRRHRRDVKFRPDGPPGQAFHVTETHDFIPAKHTLG
jgi:hypothetical protein